MAADISTSLLHYRRVMDAYYDTYTSPKPVDERDMAAFFANMQRKAQRKGGPVFRRTVSCHKLIRYQRHAISRLSKAIRST